jgi:hypothetical protein
MCIIRVSAVKVLCSIYGVETFFKCFLEATGNDSKLLHFMFQRPHISTDIKTHLYVAQFLNGKF